MAFESLPRTPYGIYGTHEVDPTALTSPVFFQRGDISRGTAIGISVDCTSEKAQPTWARRPLAYHEGAPGHAIERGFAVERDGPPFLQRWTFTAYGEGWGMYGEGLPAEFGLYRMPWDRLGGLFLELARAARLVIDTGVHAKGWSEQRARSFLVEHLPFQDDWQEYEIMRITSLPGHGCAYTVGLLKMREVRERAETSLGNAFNIRAFHTVLLEDAAPLALLEARVDAWIHDRRQGSDE